MKGIIIIGHGSRSQDAKETFFNIVEVMRKKTEYLVEGCFMEISEPLIPETVEKMYKEGLREITFVPYFLYSGMHIKKDIPEILETIKEKYKDMKFTIAKPIEFDERLIDILIERYMGEKTCI